MHVFKKVVLVISVIGFVLSAAILPGTIIWKLTAGNQNNVKEWLNDSGVYSKFGGQVFKQLEQNKDPESQLPTDDPNFRAAIEKEFSPAFLQQNVDRHLGELYGWLKNRSANVLVFDFTTDRDRLVNAITGYLRQRVAGLPACTRDNLPPPDTELLELECLPPGMDIEAEIKKIETDLTGQEGSLSNPKVQADAAESGSGSGFAAMKSAYGLFNLLFVLASAGLVIFAAIIILISAEKRKGLKKIAIVLLIFGILQLINGLLGIGIAKGMLSQNSSIASNEMAKELALPLARSAIDAATKIQLIIAAIYLVIAIAAC